MGLNRLNLKFKFFAEIKLFDIYQKPQKISYLCLL